MFHLTSGLFLEVSGFLYGDEELMNEESLYLADSA